VITFQSGNVTDVRLGDTPIKSVCIGSVEVWAAVKPVAWLKTFVDQGAHNWGGSDWVFGESVPDLSDKPAPVKGSIVFSVFIDLGNITMGVVIFDGKTWTEDPQSFSGGVFKVDLEGASNYGMGQFFSGPTAQADMTDYISTPMIGPDATRSSVEMYAAADGIHIRITDKDGANPTDFVSPYPAGVTLSDMPPTQSFT
jgi:hypothetical protein